MAVQKLCPLNRVSVNTIIAILMLSRVSLVASKVVGEGGEEEEDVVENVVDKETVVMPVSLSFSTVLFCVCCMLCVMCVLCVCALCVCFVSHVVCVCFVSHVVCLFFFLVVVVIVVFVYSHVCALMIYVHGCCALCFDCRIAVRAIQISTAATSSEEPG